MDPKALEELRARLAAFEAALRFLLDQRSIGLDSGVVDADSQRHIKALDDTKPPDNPPGGGH